MGRGCNPHISLGDAHPRHEAIKINTAHGSLPSPLESHFCGTVTLVEDSPARAGQPVTPLTQELLSISNFCDSELEFIIQGSTLKITARKALPHLSQMITVGCNLD